MSSLSRMIKTNLASVTLGSCQSMFCAEKAVKANSGIFFWFFFVGVRYGGSVPPSRVMVGLGDAIFA
jgi:hypothetical protein